MLTGGGPLATFRFFGLHPQLQLLSGDVFRRPFRGGGGATGCGGGMTFDAIMGDPPYGTRESGG